MPPAFLGCRPSLPSLRYHPQGFVCYGCGCGCDRLECDTYNRHGRGVGPLRLRSSNFTGKPRTAQHVGEGGGSYFYNPYHNPRAECTHNDRCKDKQAHGHDQGAVNEQGGRSRHESRQHRPGKPAAAASTPKATEEDARRAGIPVGYSHKHWNPAEEPLLLLGSVFDANSLGKWIYDWTVHHHGPGTPPAETAGELWLMLIQLADKIKRTNKTMPKIQTNHNREMLQDFLESGERLWVRFATLLKVCGDYMWKAAKKESGTEEPVSMGNNSGNEFVKSIFGRDRELEKMEKLMTGMRL
jgi:hypothetical protein